jgi:hypothetical protein
MASELLTLADEIAGYVKTRIEDLVQGRAALQIADVILADDRRAAYLVQDAQPAHSNRQSATEASS